MKSRILVYTVVIAFSCLLNETIQVNTNLRTKSSVAKYTNGYINDYSHFAEEMLSEREDTQIGSGYSSNKLDEESKTLDLNYSNLFKMGDNIIRSEYKPTEVAKPRQDSHEYSNLSPSQFLSKDLIDNSKPNLNGNLSIPQVQKPNPTHIVQQRINNNFNANANVNLQYRNNNNQAVRSNAKTQPQREVEKIIPRQQFNPNNSISKHVDNLIHNENKKNSAKKESNDDELDELFDEMDSDSKDTKAKSAPKPKKVEKVKTEEPKPKKEAPTADDLDLDFE